MMKGSLFQHQQQQQEENMSNLTSASGEAASVSSGNRNDTSATNFHHQYFAPPPPPPPPPPPQPLKRKRNLPGNPDPESEVIALSPKTLMATNRFVCEICNKGFQRDQNLQLHRRGHNLPWKLKQRSNKDVIKKKVYVCPEVSCVHHDPSRALGDLTGIKKHFCRKHGEKKWKCDKCSKRYAVQSDWKAHSKVCGTREYRCDCGTLFSRRDSFITHRAFCDALAEESSRAITGPPNPLLSSHQPPSISSNVNLQIPQFNTQDLHTFSLKKEQESFGLRSELPPWLACPPSGLGAGPPAPQNHQTPIDHHHHHLSSSSSSILQELSSTSNPNPSLGPTLPHYQTLPISPHMSATALLQKAAQMGATMSTTSANKTAALIRPHHHPLLHHQDQTHVSADSSNNSTGFGLNLSSRDQEQQQAGGSTPTSFIHGVQIPFGNKAAAHSSNSGVLLQEMMNSLSNSGSGFEDAFVGGVLSNSKKDGNFTPNEKNGGGGEGLTRDFLGLRAFSHSDILSMAGLGNCVNTSSSSSHDQQQHNQSQKTWRG